jgi:ubiquinone biosynthesis protein UbiJ
MIESLAALRLRERAALMRRVAGIRVRGDAEVNRELLTLAASLENEARALEMAPKK